MARAALFYFDPAWLDAWAGGRLILGEAARHTATCGREPWKNRSILRSWAEALVGCSPQMHCSPLAFASPSTNRRLRWEKWARAYFLLQIACAIYDGLDWGPRESDGVLWSAQGLIISVTMAVPSPRCR